MIPCLPSIAALVLQLAPQKGSDPSKASAELQDKDLKEGSRHDESTAELGAPSELTSWLFEETRPWRSSLSESGVTLEGYLTLDASAHFSGGRDTGATPVRGLLDVLVTLDGGKLFGIPGGELVAGLQAYGGDDGSASAGLVQNYSNIDAADDRVQLARLWYQQDWKDSGTRVRLGKMDANALFGGVSCATRFIHSSMAFSPTIRGLPTYPDTAFGIAGRQVLSKALSLRLGVFDGAAQEGVKTGLHGTGSVFGSPSDLFLIAQAACDWQVGSDHPGRLALGGWEHTGTFSRFDGGAEDGTDGLYLVLEQQLARDSAGRTFDAFLQWGEAEQEISPIATHIGCGVVASNLFLPDREDVLGLGVSSARLSDAAGAGFTAEAETAIELFWGYQMLPGIRIKPDLQYVISPGGDASLDNAWIGTLRLTVSL